MHTYILIRACPPVKQTRLSRNARCMRRFDLPSSRRRRPASPATWRARRRGLRRRGILAVAADRPRRCSRHRHSSSRYASSMLIRIRINAADRSRRYSPRALSTPSYPSRESIRISLSGLDSPWCLNARCYRAEYSPKTAAHPVRQRPPLMLLMMGWLAVKPRESIRHPERYSLIARERRQPKHPGPLAAKLELSASPCYDYCRAINRKTVSPDTAGTQDEASLPSIHLEM